MFTKIKKLMTGKYAVFWQIIFAALTLCFLWWFFAEGHASTSLKIIISILLFWLSLFKPILPFIAEAWSEGLLSFLVALFASFVGITMIIGFPIFAILFIYIFLSNPKIVGKEVLDGVAGTLRELGILLLQYIVGGGCIVGLIFLALWLDIPSNFIIIILTIPICLRYHNFLLAVDC